MKVHNLSHEVALFNEIRERIAVIYCEDDPEVLRDTASGECSIEDAIASVLREANATKAMSAGLAELIKTMGGRKDRLDNKVDRLRQIASWALGEVGMTSLIVPDMTVSIRARKPKIVIVAEGSLEAQFVKTITTTKPDLAAIQAAIDAGNVPEGVSVSNGNSVLTVRLK